MIQFKAGDRVVWRKRLATVISVRASSLYYAPGPIGYEIRLDDGTRRSVGTGWVKTAPAESK